MGSFSSRATRSQVSTGPASLGDLPLPGLQSGEPVPELNYAGTGAQYARAVMAEIHKRLQSGRPPLNFAQMIAQAFGSNTPEGLQALEGIARVQHALAMEGFLRATSGPNTTQPSVASWPGSEVPPLNVS